MGILKVPRLTTAQRSILTLEASEIVFDTDSAIYYGGDGSTIGGFPLGTGLNTQIKVDIFTLTPTDVVNKYVTLSETPETPSYVILNIAGGIVQIYGVDYSISGNILSWDSLGLDNFLEHNDVLQVIY